MTTPQDPGPRVVQAVQAVQTWRDGAAAKVRTVRSISWGIVGAASCTAALMSTGQAVAALVDRGGGMVYDTVQDLTWLAVSPLPAGPMSHAAAMTWTAGLVHGGGSDWRLPTTVQPDPTCSDGFNVGWGWQTFGVGCTGSELGQLFHIGLGGRPYESVFDSDGDSTEQLANLALFPMLAEGRYWTATLSVSHLDAAWQVDFATGQLLVANIMTPQYVLAVHGGDLAAPGGSVPTPATMPLALTGLALLLAVRPKRPSASPLPGPTPLP